MEERRALERPTQAGITSSPGWDIIDVVDIASDLGRLLD
jgi:hypothetical protein